MSAARGAPVARLAPPPWSRETPIAALVAALCEGGGSTRFVGGCVRDTLRGAPVKDIDLATPLPPESVRERVEAAGFRAIPTGIAHGTVTVAAAGRGFEVTTLRRDVKTDGRRAEVAFTDDWIADAARRDFTVNAMSLAPDGALYDPFGGRADLAAGSVRFVGDARRRIGEDYLRILRFFRFFAWLGRLPPDSEALAACAALAEGVERLSGERVRAETLKLLAAPDPLPALDLAAGAGVLRRVLPRPRPDWRERLGRLTELEGDAGDPVRRLAATVADDAPALARPSASVADTGGAAGGARRAAIRRLRPGRARRAARTARRRRRALPRPRASRLGRRRLERGVEGRSGRCGCVATRVAAGEGARRDSARRAAGAASRRVVAGGRRVVGGGRLPRRTRRGARPAARAGRAGNARPAVTGHGHSATGGIDMSMASGLPSVARPNRVPRS